MPATAAVAAAAPVPPLVLALALLSLGSAATGASSVELGPPAIAAVTATSPGPRPTSSPPLADSTDVLRSDDACRQDSGVAAGDTTLCSLSALQFGAHAFATQATIPAASVIDSAVAPAASPAQPVTSHVPGAVARGPVVLKASKADGGEASKGGPGPWELRHRNVAGQRTVEDDGRGLRLPFHRHRNGSSGGYDEAELLWAARGEALPIWMDGLRDVSFISNFINRSLDALGRERISLAVPIVGAVLLVIFVASLLAAQAWQSSLLARVRKTTTQAQMEMAEPNHSAITDSTTLPGRETTSESTSIIASGHTEDEPSTKRSVGLLELYRFASSTDKFLLCVAFFLSSIHGACMPMAFFFLDRVFKAINLPNDDGTVPPVQGPHSQRDEAAWNVGQIYLILVGTVLLTRTGGVALCAVVSDRLVFQVKRAFFNKLLEQGPVWHDVNNSSEMSGRLAQDAYFFKEGAGESLLETFRCVSMIASAVLLCYCNDWKMALVMTVTLPIIGLSKAVTVTMVKEFAVVQGDIYVAAGGVAQSAIQAIRTVTAFNGQRRTLDEYNERLKDAESCGRDMGAVQGFSDAVGWGVFSVGMSIGLYAGSCWVIQEWEHECWVSNPPFGNCRTGGGILASMFTMLWAFMMGLGELPACTEAIGKGLTSACRLYEVIDEPLVIKLTGGVVLDHVQGAVTYEGVRFSYPARLTASALNDLTLRVPAGTNAAFVGPSGSGKSTLVSLLLRFYDPQQGRITLDGHDIRGLNVKWLRSRMALVEQEPVLFGCSLAENIAYGREGEVSSKEIEKVARMANAHDFVSSFPEKYRTQVGERGAQLSGGQKQRIAIARALVRDPVVLLLDEATSALDTGSEMVVQDALDKLLEAKQRTTLIIAHRLTTVRAADQIFVLQNGHLMENGTHEELMAKDDSLYVSLAKAQFAADDRKATGPPSAAVASVRVLERALVQREASEPTPFSRQTSKESNQSDQIRARKTKPPPQSVPFWRLAALSKPECGAYVIALLCTCFLGLQTPLLYSRLSETVNLFNKPPVLLNAETGEWVPDFDVDALSHSATFLCFTQQIIGCVGTVCIGIQVWALISAAERTCTRLRVLALAAILKQEMAWFDETTSGSLAHALATRVPIIRGVLGASLIPLVQSFMSIFISFFIAFFMSWRFTLCIFLMCPLIALGFVFDQYARERKSESASTAVVAEAVSNYKTVAAFSLQTELVRRFTGMSGDIQGSEMVSALVSGIGTGIAGSALFMIYFATVMLGTKFVDMGVMAPDTATFALFMVMAGTIGLADFFYWMEKASSALPATAEAFELLDRQPLIDAMDPMGAVASQVCGRIQFRDVHFRYPTRPDVEIFTGFSLTIEPNSTTALVGQSGSGKSTVISLLQRFYDPQCGSIIFDGYDLRDLNLLWLRSQMGLVQQEPTLIAGTVLENICYGLEEVDREAAQKAAKLAHASIFIENLPKGYDTSVGFTRNCRFSGGEKQRIAIARALVRNPALLLLDEATSALDTASERVVQSALDGLVAQRSRTTIIIAHRLSTVRSADQICVVHEGQIVEQGTHDELMMKPDGAFRRMSMPKSDAD